MAGGERRSLEFAEFELEGAISRRLDATRIASLDEGKPVIPVWLDQIYQQLAVKLEKQTVK